MPRLARLPHQAKQKSALLVTLAILLNCLAPVSFAARGMLSPEPNPVPAQTDSIRRVTLTTNDLVYNKTDKTLYASVPSSVGTGGNSITPIDPVTGAVGASTFIGSEPNKLALSDDGQTLYASLDGASAIRRFDLPTKTPGQQFPIGQDSFFGLYNANDLAVAPGNPNLVAVARYYRGTSPPEAGVAVFDNGVQRTKTGPGHTAGSDFLAFSASASKLYGGGFSDGLRTMTIDSSGVTVNSTGSFSVGARIKFDNGLVFSSTGQVINPDAGTLLGTFSGATSNAFVPDTSAGRAYYLVGDQFGSGGTFTLKAFDINTFLPVGTLTIPGVVGEPTSMVRWGGNGLAFRTSGNQIFFIQTSLIPSSDPIPDPTPTPQPTPTPSPVPVAAFVRQVPLATNDLIYSQQAQTLYASVPSTSGGNGNPVTNGNSITAINPVSGTAGNSVFIGSEPNKLALSDDGQTLYVGLDGAGSVRRFDVASQTAGLQFYLGNDNFNGPYSPASLAVMPGSPGTVAVAKNNGGTAIYDDGVQRPQASSSGGSIKFGSPTTLYSSIGAIQKLAVSASGLSLVSTTTTSSSGDIRYDNGLIYMASGVVVDPEAQIIKGTFSGVIFGAPFAVDSANGRVFFMSQSSGSNWLIRSYDINTFLPIASITIQGVSGSPTSLLRWGTNGLAFRTTDKQVFLVETALVNSSLPVPSPTPTPSPTPSPSPTYAATFTRKVDLQANDLVYHQPTQTIYASVASTQGAGGNSITQVNPQTGAIGQSVFVGSEPGKLALSDDGRTLYTYLDGAKAIRRYDIQTQTPGLQFSVGQQAPYDMEVVPGSPQSLAVSGAVSGFYSAGIYDDGVQRPNSSNGGAYGIGPIEFGASPTTLYGYDSFSSGFELVKFNVNSSGLTANTITRNLITGFSNGFKFANGRLYSSAGRVVDPEAQQLVGTFRGNLGQAVAVDFALGRAFFLADNFGGTGEILTAYDINTFLPIGSVTLTGVSGTPTSLVRWGTNGLALRTFTNNGTSSSSQFYLVQSALVSSNGTIPIGVQLSTGSSFIFEGSPTATVTVNRTGDVSSATSVNYATSDGTATAGSDYVATSGTLTFAAGELSKTVNIPIIDDRLYEGGNETFNFTLSNPTGGALLTTPSTAVLTITDNDSKPSITIAPTLRVTETNSGTTNAAINVSLSNPTFQVVTVDYATADGTAKAGSDYVATSGTLTIPAGAGSATINVPVNGDTFVEPDESFIVKMSNATNVSFISTTQGTVTIANDDTPPDLSISQSAAPNLVLIGNNITYTLTLTNNSASTAESVVVTDNLPVTTAFVSCSATGGGTCGGSDNSRTATFPTLAPGASASITIIAKVNDSTSSGTVISNTATVSSALSDPNPGNNSAVATVTAATSILQFSAATYEVIEGDGGANISVTRSGNTSGAVTVNYASSDTAGLNNCDLANGIASSRCDYVTVVGTLRFAPGESTKVFSIPVVDDVYVEGPETLTLALINATGGSLIQQGTATLLIKDNDLSESSSNPINQTPFFVRQHYIDFLGREPDPAGFQGWQNTLNNCAAGDKSCDRIEVSSGFFRSTEFQERGYFTYRFYSVALGRKPDYSEFMPDLAKVSGFLTDAEK
ncbi:MAG: hypothetical protein QOH63_3588, partial [Acidobacteriota bacterium]|nr:hypothetical protein [Acidobacteriota bacterium]